MRRAGLILAALLATAAAPSRGGLHLVAPPAAPSDRLMGFTLHVEHGRVAADLGSGPISVSGEVVLMRDGALRTVKLRSLAVRPDRSP